jgi:lactate permease
MVAFLLASLPILVILALMIGKRWGASRAGGAGYLTALVVAAGYFGARPQVLAYAHAKAFFLTLDVLFIVWAAFLLYRVADEAGAIATIGRALPGLTADRGMQALLLAWAFASFLQGVGGFGVPVAVTAPLLMGLGFSPLTAVVAPSVGHSWAVSFGSLATSFQALMAATGLPGELLAPPTAVFLGLSGLLVGLMVAHAAAGWEAVKRLWPTVLAMGIVMSGTQYLLATNHLWYIASLGGGLAGLMAGVLIAMRQRASTGADTAGSLPDTRTLLIALSGYLALVVITLTVQLVHPVRAFLESLWVIQVPFPEVTTARGFVTPAGLGRKLPIFRHAGAVLVYSSVVAYLFYWRAGWYEPGAVRRIVGGTVRRVMGSSVGIASMVAMAMVMQHAGMTETLARGLAAAVGKAYPLMAPWVGALGAFMTGSNTNSNVVFAALQKRTAHLLGYSVAVILAAQSAGGALASVFAPTKVVVGASTTGMAGQEGDVMAAMGKYVLVLVTLVSVLTAGALALGLW